METTFWVLSKLLWGLLEPEKVVILLLLIGTVLIWTRRNSTGRWLITIAAIILLIPTLLPLSNFLIWPLEERFSPPAEPLKNVAGIIVLGGPERAVITAARGQPSLNQGGERLTTFIALARRYPDAKLVYAGGAGSLTKQDFKSNQTAQLLFGQLGLNADRVLLDSKARNTAENAKNVLNLLGKKPEGNWILLTSAYHMPRSVGIFRKIGWNVIPYPVDYQTSGQWRFDFKLATFNNFSNFSRGMKEWVGLVVYRLMGKTSELFPGPVAQ